MPVFTAGPKPPQGFPGPDPNDPDRPLFATRTSTAPAASGTPLQQDKPTPPLLLSQSRSSTHNRLEQPARPHEHPHTTHHSPPPPRRQRPPRGRRRRPSPPPAGRSTSHRRAARPGTHPHPPPLRPAPPRTVAKRGESGRPPPPQSRRG